MPKKCFTTDSFEHIHFDAKKKNRKNIHSVEFIWEWFSLLLKKYTTKQQKQKMPTTPWQNIFSFSNKIFMARKICGCISVIVLHCNNKILISIESTVN